eukprot:scaffold7613_cov258-Pinguiococcus_pyrenoidosus.AAC.3
MAGSPGRTSTDLHLLPRSAACDCRLRISSPRHSASRARTLRLPLAKQRSDPDPAKNSPRCLGTGRTGPFGRRPDAAQQAGPRTSLV